ncbi:MAG: cell division protein FtsZ [Pedobacter sp.]|nr:MAG: cell division protein FtsZ [Pedobacter sp.]
MNLQFDIPKEHSSIIKVIGVGGGGGNAVNHMYQQGIKGVDFMICNTDSQALDLSPIPNKIQIGNNLTEGRGAGSDPEVGRKAAQESIEEIKAVLSTNTKMIFITAGMGGGTGTGAAPVIAKIAKEMGILTVGIVTSPFMFEGPRRRSKAEEGLENLKKNVDTLLVINNERVREMYGNFPFAAAFAHADDILTTAAKGIAEIITVPGYINVDFEDVKTVMANSGVAIMGSGIAEGEERARKAVESALDSPLLSENDIHGANYILLNITSGTSEITMDEITIITEHIQEEAGLNADMIWGHCYDESLGEKIMVTLIATAFEGRHNNKTVKADEKKIVTVLDDKPLDTAFTTPVPVVAKQSTIVWADEEEEEDMQKIAATKTAKTAPAKRTFNLEDDENTLLQRRESIRTPKGLDDLEKRPAYERKKIKLKSIPHSSESNISRYTLSGDGMEENITIKPKNSFLHDNID